MTQVTTIEKLRSLLHRLMDEKSLSVGLITTAHDYLFGNNGPVPFFVNTDLFNAITYLKDIMTSNGLSHIDDIIAHFEKKKQLLASFIENLQLTDEDCYRLTPDMPIHWEKPKEIEKAAKTHLDDELCYSSCTIRPPSPLPVHFCMACIVLLPASFRIVAGTEQNKFLEGKKPICY